MASCLYNAFYAGLASASYREPTEILEFGGMRSVSRVAKEKKGNKK